jgi:hypothetical protein
MRLIENKVVGPIGVSVVAAKISGAKPTLFATQEILLVDHRDRQDLFDSSGATTTTTRRQPATRQPATMADSPVTIRTRKFITNRLLSRKQMVMYDAETQTPFETAQ